MCRFICVFGGGVACHDAEFQAVCCYYLHVLAQDPLWSLQQRTPVWGHLHRHTSLSIRQVMRVNVTDYIKTFCGDKMLNRKKCDMLSEFQSFVFSSYRLMLLIVGNFSKHQSLASVYGILFQSKCNFSEQLLFSVFFTFAMHSKWCPGVCHNWQKTY